MTARQNALVPLNAEQQAAWRAVAETEKRRHQGNTLAEYPYAGAFFRCLNGSRRISLSDLRFFMPSLTAEELRGNRSQWLYAVDVLIETQGEVCLLPLPGDAAEQLFPSVRFRVRERSRHKSALVMQKYSRQQAREAEQKTRAYQALVAQAEIELAFHSPETVGSWHARWSDRVTPLRCLRMSSRSWRRCRRKPPVNWRNRPGVNCCRGHHKKTKTNVTCCYLPMMSAACVTVQNGKAGNWMRLSGKRLPVVVVPASRYVNRCSVLNVSGW